MRPTRAQISLSAFRHNLSVAKQYAGDAGVMAVLKADGYGHGFKVLAVEASRTGLIEKIALTSTEEAKKVRDAGVECPIVLLEGVFEFDEIAWCDENNIELILHSEHQVQWIEKYSAQNASVGDRAIPLWVKVNTGMNRLGFEPVEAKRLIGRLSELDGCNIVGLMTHFACADEAGSQLVADQISRFEQLYSEVSLPVQRSLANSAGIIACPELAQSIVRPGIMLYGSSPLQGKTAQQLGLKPVMRFVSEVIAVQKLSKGDKVGYGATWIASDSQVIAVVAAGYADGYPRHASNKASVSIKGHSCPVVGRVSMDMITVDISLIADKVMVGESVELWGESMPVEQVSETCGTISYELLTGVTARVPREYID